MSNQVRIAAIIPAAGSGSRFGAAVPKQFLLLAGEPVLRRTVSRFRQAGVARIIIAVAPGAEEMVREAVQDDAVELVHGGATRQQSVQAALAVVSSGSELDLVAVHDAVRPCFGRGVWERLIGAATETGAALPVLSPVDTVHRIRSARVAETIARETLGLAQTPQLFRPSILIAAFARAVSAGITATDEAGLVAAAGYPVAAVDGERGNVKITTPEDLAWAESTAAQWSAW